MIKPNDTSNLVGPKVRQARLNARPPITQSDLAARLQVLGLGYIDQAKISRIENGGRPVYDYELVALAQVLKVSVEWLVTDTSDSYSQE
jgi:transcriptional regulator with XRE-family HTH domain